MKTGLVLGGGGLVGMAYHAGVLHSLEQEAGFVANDADLIVGTSAGSVVGAYVRAGWSTKDFWLLALGEHPQLAAIGGVDPLEARRQIMTPAFNSPFDLARRAIGSAYIAGRSVLRMPLPIPGALAYMFPGGMFTMTEGRRRFAQELPAEWPDRDLYLACVDVNTGRRVVLGRPGSPEIDLPRGVMASSAIPGLYKPVRLGHMTLVDGGAHSTTNLDLAVKAGCDRIIGVAPLAYDTSAVPGPVSQLIRRWPARTLAAEASAGRGRGAEVLLLRPTAAEVRQHGVNMMRVDGLDTVAKAAYEATCRALATDRFKHLFTPHAA
ncbi:MAG TPA: patatin-like phospholipase family protein [Acidimicrobiales bacterium]|nr:patatin-like phospholipase family protein [Acidimicrobiales bacterium]